VNKAAGAEDRFKEVSEAYEVLTDPEKKKRYDALGSGWQSGQEFRPPPGWENVQFHFSGPGRGARYGGDDVGGQFSDFFESLFGGVPGHGGAGAPWSRRPARGEDHVADLEITLEEAYHGATRTISLSSRGHTARPGPKSYRVRIPAGAADGTRIRLGGQGGVGSGGGAAGDLYLTVRIRPHAGFRLSGHDLETELRLTPWEAALGGKVPVPTLDGPATLALPAGTQSGRRFRLKGKGLPLGEGKGRGDLYATAKIVVPTRLAPREKALFEALARESGFDPREGG